MDRTDKPLFTPGPLTTSATVKEAMLHDLGSRDAAFIAVIADLRQRLLALGGAAAGDYEAVLMQGSGTFGIESVMSSASPPGSNWLILINGAYGQRMAKIASVHGIEHRALTFAEDAPVALDAVRDVLAQGTFTHVAIIHCETTSGLLNPVEEVGRLARDHGALYVVDAMSSFGGIPLDLARAGIDFLISSANKCIEGVPGFSLILARRSALLACAGQSRTLSLDLYAQWQGLEASGQFRFTPPTHAILAFHQALIELEAEGGVAGRGARYRRNHAVLMGGMQALGFRPYLSSEHQSYIITAFHYPDAPSFRFEDFYERLNARGFVIYPGKVSRADCFRIGSIGRLDEADMRGLLDAIREVLAEMGVSA